MQANKFTLAWTDYQVMRSLRNTERVFKNNAAKEVAAIGIAFYTDGFVSPSYCYFFIAIYQRKRSRVTSWLSNTSWPVRIIEKLFKKQEIQLHLFGTTGFFDHTIQSTRSFVMKT